MRGKCNISRNVGIHGKYIDLFDFNNSLHTSFEIQKALAPITHYLPFGQLNVHIGHFKY